MIYDDVQVNWEQHEFNDCFMKFISANLQLFLQTYSIQPLLMFSCQSSQIFSCRFYQCLYLFSAMIYEGKIYYQPACIQATYSTAQRQLDTYTCVWVREPTKVHVTCKPVKYKKYLCRVQVKIFYPYQLLSLPFTSVTCEHL